MKAFINAVTGDTALLVLAVLQLLGSVAYWVADKPIRHWNYFFLSAWVLLLVFADWHEGRKEMRK